VSWKDVSLREVGKVGHGRVWQGWLDWWRPRGSEESRPDGSSVREKADSPEPEPSTLGSSGWSLRRFEAQEPVDLGINHEGDVSDAELLEFLACDDDPTQADPGFKRRLKDQLWAIVQEDRLTRQ
jgi:hypothetical protein